MKVQLAQQLLPANGLKLREAVERNYTNQEKELLAILINKCALLCPFFCNSALFVG